MGCDIHLYVERKTEDGSWEAVAGRNPLIDDYRGYAQSYRERGELEEAARHDLIADEIESGDKDIEQRAKYGDEDGYYAPKRFQDWAYNGRNYTLFGILAGVRNYDVPRIADDKGMPDDVSNLVGDQANYWEDDGHSHSYLTLQELKDFDWEQGSQHSGWVSETVYKQWKETGNPYPCASMVGGGAIAHITEDEMKQLVNGSYPRDPDKKYYTKIHWTETLKDSVGSFYTDTISALEKLSKHSLGDDVRIVFWFDN